MTMSPDTFTQRGMPGYSRLGSTRGVGSAVCVSSSVICVSPLNFQISDTWAGGERRLDNDQNPPSVESPALTPTPSIIGSRSPQDMTHSRRRSEEKGYFCQAVRETRGKRGC